MDIPTNFIVAILRLTFTSMKYLLWPQHNAIDGLATYESNFNPVKRMITWYAYQLLFF